jgi:hypothetical protein
MPVKLTPNEPIPFLAEYIPPTISGQLVENIQDMISVDLQSLDIPFQIEYPIGAYEEDQQAFQVTFRNLTTNATLTIIQEQTQDLLLLLDNNVVVIPRRFSLPLNPGETRTVNILFNNRLLNSRVQTNVLELLQLIVQYEKTGSLVIRNTLDVLPRITI